MSRRPAEPAPRRLRRAEAVLARRTQRIRLLVERPRHDFNAQAVLRTAEAFGVQHVWWIDRDGDPAEAFANSVTKGAWRWLTVQRFPHAAAAVAALAAEAAGGELWATDLGEDAETLDAVLLSGNPFPARVTVAVGREEGASETILAAAHRRLRMPMAGFSDSLNLNVAAALVLQRIFDACPQARGDLDAAERETIRARWYRQLAGNEENLAAYLPWIEAPPEPAPQLRPPLPHRGHRYRDDADPEG
ncbi:MAG TPA: TrmH family RNA methyltransferase [Planctomycetota bacterium]